MASSFLYALIMPRSRFCCALCWASVHRVISLKIRANAPKNAA
jgi:hypothetical protein